MGIGHPGDKSRVTGYVLGDFAKQEHDWLVPLIAAVAQESPALVKGDNAGFMNKVALHLQKENPQAKTGAKPETGVKKVEKGAAKHG